MALEMEGDKLRDGIFALRTTRFGSVAECMVRRLRSYSDPKSVFHDLYDEARHRRIEVKFSIVRKTSKRRVTEHTVLQCIEEAVAEERMIAFANWRDYEFDCNIQQIKRAEFDVLYYGLFFFDCIKIFRLASEEIRENREGGIINYSDSQHKGNKGEGQFHLNPQTLQAHLDRYLYKTLTYAELYEVLGAST